MSGRPPALFWPRVIARIDHPDAHLIPLLTAEPVDHWPQSLIREWPFSGAMTMSHCGTAISVPRMLYHLLIRPLKDNEQVRAKARLDDVNPLNRYVVTIAEPPPASTLHIHEPALAKHFDVNDVAEMLDELNPRSVTDIRHLLDDYYPIQIFEALKKANLHTRLGLKSPMELQP